MAGGYVFGPFTLDCRRQRLLRDGEPLALTGKTFEVLRVLIEHRERLVEKEELLRLVWPDVVVDEANLTQHIFTVRKLLGDSSQNARYVLTVSRRGYRFIADVLEVGDETSGDVPGRTHNLPAIRALAILPFSTISGSDEEYLGLGLADAVIARMAKLATVPVRPTNAIRRYTAGPHDSIDVARELRVDAVVEGTIRRDADRIRVTVQLVHVRTGAPLWADQFDTALSNLFSVEDSISTRIAESLVVTLTGDCVVGWCGAIPKAATRTSPASRAATTSIGGLPTACTATLNASTRQSNSTRCTRSPTRTWPTATRSALPAW